MGFKYKEDKELLERVFLAFRSSIGSDRNIDIAKSIGGISPTLISAWKAGGSSPRKHMKRIADVTGCYLLLTKKV